MLNIDNAKSYATKENLEAALVRFGLDHLKYLVVRNTEGRWTALFLASFIFATDDIQPFGIAHRGFMVVG